jgi:hypothetical protein
LRNTVLTWADADTGVTFNVYRASGVCPATTGAGTWTKLNAVPVTALTYTDLTVGGVGSTYCYYVTALSGGIESAPSNMTGAIIPEAIPVLAPVRAQ